MAVVNGYATAVQVRDRIAGSIAGDDSVVELVLGAISRRIDQHCGRIFYDVDDEPSSRSYKADTSERVEVDDFHTVTGLVVKTDEDDDGTFDTTWSASDYQVEPLNGVWNGSPGWPFWQLRAVESRYFPCGRRATVQITARWGWAAVPEGVREACILQAERLNKRGDAPFGVAGSTDMGAVVRLLAKLDPDVEVLLGPFRKHKALVG